MLALTEVNIDGNLLWLNFSIKNHVRNTEVKRRFSYSKELTVQSRTYNLKEEKDNLQPKKIPEKRSSWKHSNKGILLVIL